ncbi:MAG: hypothetical protein KW804_00025 [Candidatus Doudnabacteria bacterium]|nr:hypothetical protein [Candidatus Doudnabacteria bacterium]
MMRKQLLVALASLVATVGCSEHGSSSIGPISPSNTPITLSSPKIKLAVTNGIFSSSVPGRCLATVTISGANGPGDLRDGLPLDNKGPNLEAGESWSGSWIRIVDWRLNPLGVGNQTNNTFNPPARDMYRMVEAPYDCAKGPDWTFEWIPGGQITVDNGLGLLKPDSRKVPILMNQSNVIIELVKKVNVTFPPEKDSRGLQHMVFDGAPF